MSYKGIDISEHNGAIYFDSVAKNVDFAIIRIGYGVSYLPNQQKDKYFEKNYNGLHGRIPIGIYYYSYAKNIGDGIKEAQNCLRYLNGRDIELPIFYDVEDNSMNHINEVAREFVQTIRSAGYKTGIYTYKYWLESGKVNHKLFDDCMKWWAAYGKNNGYISGYCPAYADIWQYTSKGIVPGISGNVDMNTTEINFKKEGEPVKHYYDEAWEKAKALNIIQSSKPEEPVNKAWVIYILYKLGVIK